MAFRTSRKARSPIASPSYAALMVYASPATPQTGAPFLSFPALGVFLRQAAERVGVDTRLLELLAHELAH
jgi:hypothetical protein